MRDPMRLHDAVGLTSELEHARRFTRTSLALSRSALRRLPVLAQLRAVDAELPERAR